MRKSGPLVGLSILLVFWPAMRISAQNPAPAMNAGTITQARIEPPRIIFSPSPAVLVLIDGDPAYRNVDGTSLQRVVNTKALILRDETDVHYLRIHSGWMEAYSLDDWWSRSGVAPEGARIALSQAVASKSVDLLDDGKRQDIDASEMPAIYVSTVPAVLIVTDGPPRFATIPGTSLEYMENTSATVFREPTDQELYLLLSGRWFRSWKTEGPWQFVASDQLPGDFAKIPGNLLKR